MLNTPLTLPCGVTVKNRLVKAAMSENMASAGHKPNPKFARLYSNWTDVGLVITGNVMIDSSALGEVNNVVIEKGCENKEELKLWAQAGTKKNCQLWVQLNHPGKQSPKFLSPRPVAPSAIAYQSDLKKMFNPPQELSTDQIKEIIKRFAYAAAVAKECGFSGVQIHAAHGYLISQFLSPLSNQRPDKWGQDRALFLQEVYKAIRAAVGDDFPVGVKLNSSDFQKGGLGQEESLGIIKRLSTLGLDLIEISGGTYEAPIMMEGQKESTKKREAYFQQFSGLVKENVSTPIVLTGGFRSAKGMEEALQSKACDLIGLARSLALDPKFADHLLTHQQALSQVTPKSTGIKAIDKIIPLEIIWYTDQIHRMGRGLAPNPQSSPLMAIARTLIHLGAHILKRPRL